jgi:hypothetical protein
MRVIQLIYVFWLEIVFVLMGIGGTYAIWVLLEPLLTGNVPLSESYYSVLFLVFLMVMFIIFVNFLYVSVKKKIK